jgi:hypothetical protein
MTLVVGQIWRHVGGGGVPPTGLRVRVERFDERGRAVCSYPDVQARRGQANRASVVYRQDALVRMYELETVGRTKGVLK